MTRIRQNKTPVGLAAGVAILSAALRGNKVDNLESLQSQQRAALYVDGFNLYHPIAETGQNHLKWACLHDLGKIICEKENANLVRVVLCTAVPKHLPEKRDRHNKFNAAQRARGVDVINGHHVYEADREKYAEKQSDINVALELITDGLADIYDIAYLLSADSDQAATARVFADKLMPLGKRMIGVAPFGRKVPTLYEKYGIKGFAISQYQLECCVMEEAVPARTGPIMRPVEYAHPPDWIHPNKRPKGRPPKAPKKWGKKFTA